MSQTTSNVLIEIADKIKDLKETQIFGTYSSISNFFSPNKKYCALGGVAENFGMSEYDLFIKGGKYTHDFIALKLGLSENERSQSWQCSKCELVRSTLQIITHLNDVHHIKFNEFPEIVKSIKPTSKHQSHQLYVFYSIVRQGIINSIKKHNNM